MKTHSTTAAQSKLILDQALIIAQNHGLETAFEEYPELGEVQSVTINGRTCEYLNSGDTYQNTVCCEYGNCWIGTWGDWVEEVEDIQIEEDEEETEAECRHCGIKKPIEKEWTDNCRGCGKKVY